MSKILSTTRSFGIINKIGKDLLEKEGHIIYFVPNNLRPLNRQKLYYIIKEFNPDALIIGADKIDKKIISENSNLKIIVKRGVGLDNIDTREAIKKDIVVSYTPGTNNEAVADFTIGLILNIARKISIASNSLRSGIWESFIGDDLYRKIVGVIGTGKIGSSVIRRLIGFEVKVLAHDVNKNKSLEEYKNVKYVAMDELITLSDFITVHVPLTINTKHLINSDQFSRMKKNAYLINTSRGEIIDEDELYEALILKKIKGAAIDVWKEEPPFKSKLLNLDNVLPTPHIAAVSENSVFEMDKMCAEIIINFFKGKMPEFIAKI